MIFIDGERRQQNVNMTKKKIKTFSNLSDLIRSASDDQEFNEKLDNMIQEREVVTTLFALRMARNVPQGEVARRLGCSQSRVSKIENGVDGDLRLRELSAYAEAMDYNIEVAFTPKNETIVGAVKRHAFRVKALLCRLAELSHKDSQIAEGAAVFFGEAFVNFVKIISDSAKQLPERPDGKSHIEITIEDDRSCDLDRARRRLATASPEARKRARGSRDSFKVHAADCDSEELCGAAS